MKNASKLFYMVALWESSILFIYYFVTSHRRNLDHFLSCMQSAVNAVDPETGGGELTIRIPKEVLGCAHGEKNSHAVIMF